MKPPKNFYSNLDRRKQGLPEVPEASAADAGKIIKVGSDGSYELGDDVPSELPTTIFSPTEPIGPYSNQPIDFDLNDLNLYKFMAVYYRYPYDTNQMSCWYVPVSYVDYCIDNDLYMALTGFGGRYVLFKFSIRDNVPSIVTTDGDSYAIYKIILYR